MAEKIRIKDIAKNAGVSVGTVDRVLHNRPNVSKAAREKVNKALEDADYHPNMYASALAYNKSYSFYFIMPLHESEAYWQEIEDGAFKACEARRDFNINIKIMYYSRLNNESFVEQYEQCLKEAPDGVVIVPFDMETTRKFTDMLHKRNIPFVLLDSYMPDLKPLSFYGQDSISSGYFAAKMMMLIASGDDKIMIMRQTRDGEVLSKQQANREVGFRKYMKENYPNVEICEVELPLDGEKEMYEEILSKKFDDNKGINHCITFNSKAHILCDFIVKKNKDNVKVIGYDMVPKNAEYLRRGTISFLIAQHAYMQGYFCVDTLFNSIVLKKSVEPLYYMPIELLTKENVDFYRHTLL